MAWNIRYSAGITADSAPASFDFYIGPSGNDTTGDGSVGNPWAITALTSKAAQIAGNSVGLLDGTYRFSGTPGIDIPSSFSGGGVGSETLVQSVNPRLAILTNNSDGAGTYVQSSATTQVMRLNADYVTLKDLVITDSSGHGVVLQDANNILIEGCKITDLQRGRNTAGAADTNHGGIYCETQTTPKTNVTVRNCEIGDIYSQNLTIVGNNSNAIGDLFGAVNWIMEYNTVYRCGVLAYWKGQMGNHTVRYNLVYDCGGFLQGYAVEETSGTTFNRIYNNIAIVNFCGGPQSGNTHDGATLTEFYNNTIILKPIAGNSDTSFGTWTCPGGGSPAAVMLYNNLVYVDASMTGGYQELYSHGTQIAPRLRYTTNGGVRDYNSWTVFRVNDSIGGVNFDGASGLTAIRLGTSGGWTCDAQTEIVSNFGFVDVTGTDAADFQLTGSGIQANTGKVGGVSGGANITRGAWDGVVAQIGKDW